jgi:hypothetical protein
VKKKEKKEKKEEKEKKCSHFPTLHLSWGIPQRVQCRENSMSGNKKKWYGSTNSIFLL